MASKRMIGTIGAFSAMVLIGGTYMGVVSPLLEEKQSIEMQIDNANTLNDSYLKKLSGFKGGENDETRKAADITATFNSLVAGSIDIESASRAIAASLPSGVKLTSFNFGAMQKVTSRQSSPVSISGFTAPSEFSNTKAEAAPAAKAASQEAAVNEAGGSTENLAPQKAAGVDPSAPVSEFNRIPFTIEVSASSYGELSKYLDSLSQQPRLMNVVSVDSSRSDSVSAKVYAFAFAGK